MRRAISSALVLILCLCLCGCSFPVKDIVSEIGDLIKDRTITDGIGIFFNKDISGEKVKKIEKTEVESDGITTLCYEALTKSQKSIYKYLLTAANDMPDGWVCCGKKTDDYVLDISRAYKALLNDNPQIFWMPISYGFGLSDDNMCIAFSVDDGEDVKCDYTVKKKDREGYASKLDEAVDYITALAQSCGTEYEKELFVHDYICGTVEYNLDGGSMIYTSYGALVDGVGVCEGYSRAMQLIMQKLGIKCGLVYGIGNDDMHMWNYINIGGQWYNVDLTWDKSQDYGTLHTYFNLTDDEMKGTHTVTELLDKDHSDSAEMSYNVLKYNCNATEYNYYSYNNFLLTDNVQDNAVVILQSYTYGKTFSEFKNKMSENEEVILNSVAEDLFPHVSLKSYVKTGDILLIFFENTY